MKQQDTKAQDFEGSNTELIKSIFVGMAIEANIATLQGINPSKVYRAINTSAVENTNFIIKALKKEREEGIKQGIDEGERIGKKVTFARVVSLISVYKESHKEEKINIDAEKFIAWINKEQIKKGNEKIKSDSITCPYCGETGFDKMTLKNHLQYKCKEFINQEEAETVD